MVELKQEVALADAVGQHVSLLCKQLETAKDTSKVSYFIFLAKRNIQGASWGLQSNTTIWCAGERPSMQCSESIHGLPCWASLR